jgi:hypothetical protein
VKARAGKRTQISPMVRSATTREKWYSATVLFESAVSGSPSLRPLCEERVVLVQAANEARARAVVMRYAKEEQHSYPNVYGQAVAWRFIEIEKVEEAEKPDSGPWEVASRFVRRRRKSLRDNKSSGGGRTRSARRPRDK